MSVLVLQNLVVRFGTDLSAYTTGLNQAERMTISTATRINTVLGGMFSRLATTMGRVALDFDEAMADTMAVLHDATTTLHGEYSLIRNDLERSILDMSRTSMLAGGPVQLARAYEQLARSGLDAANVMSRLSTVERFAVTGRMNAVVAARELYAIQRGMGGLTGDAARDAENMTRIGDVVLSISNRAGVSAESLALGLARLAPTLRLFGRDVEEGASLLGVMASQTQNAGRAATLTIGLMENLGRLFIRSTLPPGNLNAGMHREADRWRMRAGVARVHPNAGVDEGVRMAADSWRGMGVEVFDAGGRMRSVADIVMQLEERMRGLTDQQKVARLVMLGFTRENSQAMVALYGNAAALQEFYLSARNAGGMMERIYNDRLRSFNAQWTIAQNNIEVIGIEIGRLLVPALIALNSILIYLFDTWNNLTESERAGIFYTVAIIASMLLLKVAVYLVMGVMGILWSLTGGLVLQFLRLGYVGVATLVRWLAVPLFFALVRTYSMLAMISRFVISSAVPSLMILTGAIRLVYGSIYFLIGVGVLLTSTMAAMYGAGVVMTSMFIQMGARAWLSLNRVLSVSTRMVQMFTQLSMALITIGAQAAASGMVSMVSGLVAVITNPALYGTLAILGLIIGAVLLVRAYMSEWSDSVENLEMDWEALGSGIIEIIWTIIGFMYNFNENINIIMNAIRMNWASTFNAIGVMFVQLIQVLLHNTRAWIMETIGIMDVLRRWRVNGRHEAMSMSAFADRAVNTIVGNATFGAPALNTTLPPDVRRALENFAARAGRHLAGDNLGDPAGFGSRIGANFREVSLRRHMLDTSNTGARPEGAVVSAPGVETRVDTLIRLAERAMGMPPRPPAVGP